VGPKKEGEMGNCTIWFKVTGKKKVNATERAIWSTEGVEASKYANCTVFSKIEEKAEHVGAFSHHGPPRPPGTCKLYRTAHGKYTRKHVTSGGAYFHTGSSVKLYPSWPAGSPWITAVGATRFVHVNESFGEEMATDQFGSGGGFSWLFKSFEAQETLVEKYLKTVTPTEAPVGSYPPKGRATPDVSAMGEGFQVVINGETETVGGTSASAPTFAGIVSMLNEARIKAGMKPLGYLNPFLYSHSSSFTDITAGTNAIGRGNGPLPYGFPAAKGWDAATGIGTPIFSELLKAAMVTGERTK
jgi:hypothetical protein